ncbi:MAG: Sua5/YciO/YrdC/YwlC family protein [Halofilum sp. (in: g-proteobacteria)]|nr:Sua5/YciO/YrdC/YwlC family protein [Halofilum sp. (in: g-proteobacteria)]
MDAAALATACRALARGGIVAYPTEAVFGLGCDPADAAAVDRLLALKGRPWQKGLILIAADETMLQPWIGPLDDDMRVRLEGSWPGPATWLLPAATDCPQRVRGEHETIAVRVTDHPVAAALCRAWGGALVSTSANRGGGEPARDAATVRDLFGDDIEFVLDAPVGGLARPTPIRDARTGATLRD